MTGAAMMDVACSVNRKQPQNCPAISSLRFINASGQLNQRPQRSITPRSPVETQPSQRFEAYPPTTTPSPDPMAF